MGKEQLTVTIEENILKEVKELAGSNISNFVENALIDYLQGQTTGSFPRCSICGLDDQILHVQNDRGNICEKCFLAQGTDNKVYCDILGLKFQGVDSD